MVDDNPRESGLDSDTEGSGAAFGAPQAPRRSTWSPSVPPVGGDAADTSDDDLARALEEDFERATHSGVFPVVDPTTPAPLPEAPVPDDYTSSTQQDQRPVDWDPVVGINVEPPASMTNGPPARRSIPTTELAAMLAQQAEAGDGSVDVMAQLEDQLRLREQDASEFLRWQESKVAEGSAAALAEVEAARANFVDIVDSAPQAPPAAPEASAGPTPTTHRFRVDEVLDSDLLSAPAPMTAPVSDIPPPSDHTPAPIPNLVEPSAPAAASDPFDFDALIGGETRIAEEVPTVFSLNDAAQPAPEPPMESASEFAVDSLRDADVSDTDQVFADLMGPFPVTSEGVVIVPTPPVVPFEPISGVATSSTENPENPESTENPAVEATLTGPRAFQVEESSTAPTPTDQRVGRAARLFWLWFAANSSVVSVAFGGAVLALGMSLRQAIVATLIGVAVSFLPLGLGTLAGKWSGQPTMIVSRATFGHLGNILPAVLALIVRLFWGAVLLWFLAAGTARILVGAELSGPLTETQVMIIGLAVGFLLALVIAFFGYGLIARIHLVFTIISGALIAGLLVITWPAVNIPMALTVGDGPWILVVTGAVLVFSFVGLVWAVSSADLARYQRASGSGAASMLWSTFGATIPAFVLIVYGAFLAASNPEVAEGLLATPLDTIALLIPIWYPVPLIAALALSLLAGVVISIYSGGFALQATGASMRRPAAVVIVGAGVAILAVVLAFSIGDYSLILRDVATTLAVPIAAWAGIFGAEMMIRNRKFSPQALLQRGGVYADVHWVNFAMLLVASVVGFGLTTGTVAWLSWQGYLYSVLGVPLSDDLAASDLGVFVALAIGILTPIIAGIPGIRRQESAAIERPQDAVR